MTVPPRPGPGDRRPAAGDGRPSPGSPVGAATGGRFSLPGVRAARRLAAGSIGRVGDLAAAPVRILGRIEQLLERIDRTIDRVDDTEAGAAQLVRALDELRVRAARELSTYSRTLQLADASARGWLPVLDALRPAGEELAASLGAGDAARLLEATRMNARLADELDDQILPTLHALRSVAPDLHQLVALSRGLNELVGTLPGLGKVKKRIDEEVPENDDR